MKHPYLKNPNLRLITCFIFLCAASIINSCRKDTKNASQTALPLAISQAKTWYESTYPLTSGTTGKLATQSTTNTAFDLSQLIKPDWQHSSSYIRLGKSVIEMPLDPSINFGSDFKNNTTKKIYSDKKYNRTYFLLLNDGKSYQAFVMMIMADSAYVKNDLSKLTHNSYRKHDADFTGLVLYFTPNGRYVGGYTYSNGNLITPSSSNQSSGSQTVQSVNNGTSKLTTNELEVCTDWYLDYYVNGVFWYSVSLGTTCEPSGGGTSGSPSSGSPGSTDGGTPPAPPPPPPCPTSSGTGTESVNHLTIDVTEPPPGDGGMPAPNDPCTVTTPTVAAINTITDSVTNPCLKAIIDNLTNNQTIQTDVTNVLRNTFGTSDQINITFDQATLTGAYSTADANTGGNQLNNLVVTFNTPLIANASKEFLLETTMHEIFHAYLYVNPTIKNGLSQHTYMIQNYVNTEVATLQQVFPNLSTHDAQCLVLGGYGDLDPTTFNTALATYNLTSGDVATTNNNYKSGTSGTHC